MKRTVLIGLVSVLVIAGLAIGIPALISAKGPSNPAVAAAGPGLTETADTVQAADGNSGYEDATYTIDGMAVTLVNGVAEVDAAPGSASKVVTRSFGKSASGDLNADGQADVAFILTQDGGGSGTFYYVVTALKAGTGFKGTNAVLLGDRISPQSISIQNGLITVQYLDRKPDEPMSAEPTVSASKQLKVVDGQLSEASAS